MNARPCERANWVSNSVSCDNPRVVMVLRSEVSNVPDGIRAAPRRIAQPPDCARDLEAAVRAIGRVVRGKEDVIRLAIVGFLARGHVLLEDVPGVGKTTLARAFAAVLGGTMSRIQLTSDLLPADIVGAQVIDRATGKLEFRPGPVFANVVLADELNRATPRTQSGLLEAMAERSVSIDGTTHALPEPFFVIATQNPIEHHGVHALPQSQLDRFCVRTAIGYPEDDVERSLLMEAGTATQRDDERSVAKLDVAPVFDRATLDALFSAVDGVTLGSVVAEYLHDIVKATRASRLFETGVSTRGALVFGRAARARALLEGRTFVTPDDVRALAVPVCAHRVAVRGNDRPNREDVEAILREIADEIPVPV